MSLYRKGVQKLVGGFRPVVHSRQALMLGIRQPLDGQIFESLEHAQYWCWHAMLDHYERGLGMSDAKIYPFTGVVAS